MSRYDGLIIPRSYSEYINKTDAATISQALQLGGVLAQQVSAGNNAAVTSNAVNGALVDYKKPSVNKVVTLTTSTNCVATAIWTLYSSYDTNNFHYFKYLVIDDDGNTLTEYIKYKHNNSVYIVTVFSNGITRTNQNTVGTLVFSSFKNITFWEVTQADYEQANIFSTVKLTNFTPSDYSDEESFYKALVARANAIKSYGTVEGTILWANHWYGVVRVFTTSATSGTIEVVDHSKQQERIVKVSGDTVTVKTVIENDSLTSTLTNYTKYAEIISGDSDLGYVTIDSLTNNSPISIFVIGYNGIDIIHFTSGLNSGVVLNIGGSANVTYDQTTHRITATNKNRVIQIYYCSHFTIS